MDSDIENEIEESLKEFPLLSKKDEKRDGISLWKALLFLLLILLCLLLSSFIICLTDYRCKTNIPTVNTLLNSSLASPFIITSINAGVGAHALTSIALYYRAKEITPVWARLQLLLAFILYCTFAIVLFVYPFTLWDKDWANVSSLIVMALWIFLAQIVIVKINKSRFIQDKALLRISFAAFIMYILSSIVYIVLRAVPSVGYAAGIVGKNIGILVSEILFGLSLVLFMILVVVHIRDIRIWFYTYDKKEK